MTLLRRLVAKTPKFGYCLKHKQDITEQMFRNRECWKGSNKTGGCQYRVLEIPIVEIVTTKNNIPIIKTKRRN